MATFLIQTMFNVCTESVVTRRFHLSAMTHQSPYFKGIMVIRANKVAMYKMAIVNALGPVLINVRCIGYMLADHS